MRCVQLTPVSHYAYPRSISHFFNKVLSLVTILHCYCTHSTVAVTVEDGGEELRKADQLRQVVPCASAGASPKLKHVRNPLTHARSFVSDNMRLNDTIMNWDLDFEELSDIIDCPTVLPVTFSGGMPLATSVESSSNHTMFLSDRPRCPR